MARKRSSGAEGFMDLIALMPWWAGVVAAIGSYIVLHSIATSPLPAVQPGKVAGALPGMMMRGLATAGQYVVPLLCILGALASFFRRRKRAQLAEQVAHSGQRAVAEMSWREFEMLVGEAFRIEGYSVTETGGGGADGGVDLVLRKDGKTYLVQCKQWKAFTVPVTTVRELFGVIVDRRAAGGFVVSSGRFTADAQAFADGKNIQLLDGAELVRKVKRQMPRAAARPELAPAAPVRGAAPVPACPVCNSPMVLRTAKKGANAGNQFWGCSRYPSCRGTR
jgi:restriction system protein